MSALQHRDVIAYLDDYRARTARPLAPAAGIDAYLRRVSTPRPRPAPGTAQPPARTRVQPAPHGLHAQLVTLLFVFCVGFAIPTLAYAGWLAFQRGAW